MYDYSDQVYEKRHHLLFAGDRVWPANFSCSEQNAASIMEWTLAFKVPINKIGFERERISKRSQDESINDSTYTTSTTASTNSSSNQPVSKVHYLTEEEAIALCKTCIGLDDSELELISQSGMMSCVSDAMVSGSNIFCGSHSRMITKNLIDVSHSNDALTANASNKLSSFVLRIANSDCGVNGFKSDGACHCDQGLIIHSFTLLTDNDNRILWS